MAEFSILNYEMSAEDTIALSPYYIDFNIDRIIKEINLLWKEDVSSLYRYFPSNVEGQEYRKEIYKDISKEGMVDLLMDFRGEMKQRETILKSKELTRSSMQKMVMSLSEMRTYFQAVDQLVSGLEQMQLTSQGMLCMLQLLKEYVADENYQKTEKSAVELQQKLSGIPFKLTYKDRFLYVTFEEVEGKYDSFLKSFEKSGKQESKSFFQKKNPLGEAIEITEMEEAVLEILYKKETQLFKDIKQFVDENEKYAKDFVMKFAKEIAFYLSFKVFESEMVFRGLHFAMPEHSHSSELMAGDLYDLALGCQLSKTDKLPVSNDVKMAEGENFFVLTGPNQGGKTTFARSLGQLVFFSKLGLPVPARRASVPFYSRILTHFSVEESVQTGKGKLAEELSRLAPMMEDKSQDNDFVVINELFTTAANYDACIMGKRVLDHFVAQNSHGIYVTHLQDLSKEDKGIVSLRAMMNEEHKQNFKIVRSTAPALESSILLVEKHRLQYENVKMRLKGETV